MGEFLLNEKLLQAQQQLRENVLTRTNTLLIGGAGSGKTTMLDAVSRLTPGSIFLGLNLLDGAGLNSLMSTIGEAETRVIFIDELAAVCNFPRLQGLPDFILRHSDITWIAATPSLTTLMPKLIPVFQGKIALGK